MGLTLKGINKYYKTPAKRGMKVRCGSKHGVITSPNQQNFYFNVRWDGDKRSTPVHPFDLDYCVDGQWKLGKEMCDRFNAAIDKWNERMNRGVV